MNGPRTPVPTPRSGSPRSKVGLGAALLVLLACTQTSVEPVAVASITITPERFTTLVADEMPLAIEILDLDGQALSRPDVVWASMDPGVATISDAGVVRAVSPGQALITAKVDGAVGTAQATVEARPETRLSPGSLNLSGTEGGGVIRAVIRVSNQGGGTLDDLSVVVTDGGNWIDASLDRGQAPTDLTLVVRPGSLSRGTYRGRVQVRSNHGSRTATINLEVKPRPEDPNDANGSDNSDKSDKSDNSDGTGDSGSSDETVPRAPDDLDAEEDGETRIELEWEDRSDNEKNFEIQRRRPGRSWTTIATVGRNRESYRDAGLQEDTTYEYRIRACNDAGCSRFSKKAKATTDDD